MVVHQAICMDSVLIPFHPFLEKKKKTGPIRISKKMLPTVTTLNDVVDSAWIGDAWFGCHNILSNITQTHNIMAPFAPHSRNRLLLPLTWAVELVSK